MVNDRRQRTSDLGLENEEGVALHTQGQDQTLQESE